MPGLSANSQFESELDEVVWRGGELSWEKYLLKTSKNDQSRNSTTTKAGSPNKEHTKSPANTTVASTTSSNTQTGYGKSQIAATASMPQDGPPQPPTNK
jgi:hypothetical protein